jgi:hypothetical protein
LNGLPFFVFIQANVAYRLRQTQRVARSLANPKSENGVSSYSARIAKSFWSPAQCASAIQIIYA